MQISAVLIVKNEAPVLAACLGRLRGVVDEVVVADTGSSDGTPTLAAQLADRLVFFSWVDDFSAARNFALDHATGDYILHVDADDFLENAEEARSRLAAFGAQHGPQVVGTVAIESRIGEGREALSSIEIAPRFFARGHFRYAGRIHEQLESSSGTKDLAATGLRYRHSGYQGNAAGAKSERNKRMLRAALAQFPEDEYYWYQLGKAHFSLKERREAVTAFERALSCIRFDSGHAPVGHSGHLVAGPVLSDLLCSLAYTYVNLGEAGKARALLDRHVALGHAGTRSADLYHALGYANLMLGDLARARAGYEQSLRIGVAGERVRGTGSFSSEYHLGLLAETEQDLPKALTHYLRSLTLLPDYGVTLSRCVELVTEYRIGLPAELWAVCDHKALSQAFLDKLGVLVQSGAVQDAGLLSKASGGLSSELADQCAQYLQHFVLSRGEG